MKCTHDVTNENGGTVGKDALVLGGGPFLDRFRGALTDGPAWKSGNGKCSSGFTKLGRR
ncbi:MAG: hypothetical protein SGI77_03635 [Pirellulaceae bacterium]|nr:hypothetical protein [Pirellulaceae bacterium]